MSKNDETILFNIKQKDKKQNYFGSIIFDGGNVNYSR